MYSYEDRLRAVQLYIKLGKRIGLTIRQLGWMPSSRRCTRASPARS
jgi:transposase-like protein